MIRFSKKYFIIFVPIVALVAFLVFKYYGPLFGNITFTSDVKGYAIERNSNYPEFENYLKKISFFGRGGIYDYELKNRTQAKDLVIHLTEEPQNGDKIVSAKNKDIVLSSSGFSVWNGIVNIYVYQNIEEIQKENLKLDDVFNTAVMRMAFYATQEPNQNFKELLDKSGAYIRDYYKNPFVSVRKQTGFWFKLNNLLVKEIYAQDCARWQCGYQTYTLSCPDGSNCDYVGQVCPSGGSCSSSSPVCTGGVWEGALSCIGTPSCLAFSQCVVSGSYSCGCGGPTPTPGGSGGGGGCGVTSGSPPSSYTCGGTGCSGTQVCKKVDADPWCSCQTPTAPDTVFIYFWQDFSGDGLYTNALTTGGLDERLTTAAESSVLGCGTQWRQDRDSCIRDWVNPNMFAGTISVNVNSTSYQFPNACYHAGCNNLNCGGVITCRGPFGPHTVAPISNNQANIIITLPTGWQISSFNGGWGCYVYPAVPGSGIVTYQYTCNANNGDQFWFRLTEATPSCQINMSVSSPMQPYSSQSVSATVVNQTNGVVDEITYHSTNPSVAYFTPDPNIRTTATGFVTTLFSGTPGTSTIQAVGRMTASNTYCIPNPATVNVAVNNTSGWWQSRGGDVLTYGSISDQIPTVASGFCTGTCDPKLISTLGDLMEPDPGIAIYGGSITPSTMVISSNNRNANSNQILKLGSRGYSDILRKVPTYVVRNTVVGASIASSTLAAGVVSDDGYIYWFADTGLTLTGDVNFDDKKIVLFVNGLTTLQGRINLNGAGAYKKGFFMLVSNGDINVDPLVGGSNPPQLEGIYLATGSFYTGVGTTKLTIRGSVAAVGTASTTGSIVLTGQRNLTDNTSSPAEVFDFAPDQLILYPRALGIIGIQWKEVAP